MLSVHIIIIIIIITIITIQFTWCRIQWRPLGSTHILRQLPCHEARPARTRMHVTSVIIVDLSTSGEWDNPRVS
jgi:hypothetical protein